MWGQMLAWTELQESCLPLWLYTDARVLALLGICGLTTLCRPRILLSTAGLAHLLLSFDVFDLLWVRIYQLSSWGWGGIFNILKSFQLLACRPGLKNKNIFNVPYGARSLVEKTHSRDQPPPLARYGAAVAPQSSCVFLGKPPVPQRQSAVNRHSQSQGWQTLI